MVQRVLIRAEPLGAGAACGPAVSSIAARPT
jgi:hypothetical protein